jgi:protein SCO1/2
MTRFRLSFVLILFVLLGETLVAQMATPTPPPNIMTDVGIDQRLNEQIPLDLSFRDEKGDTVKLADYFHSKPVIVSLVYYRCPMLCTQVLNGMVETFKTLKFTAGKEFEIVTVSIDPSEQPDLAADKKEQYVEEYGREGVAQGWHFLTGDQSSIAQLAKAVGYRYVYDPNSKQFAHGAGIMVATPRGKLASYLYGIEYGARDLRFALMEAAQERIGSPVDRILLLCYHYDPTTGKYGIVVTNLLKGSGILAVLILGGYMLINFLRDRQKTLHALKS